MIDGCLITVDIGIIGLWEHLEAIHSKNTGLVLDIDTDVISQL